MTGSFDVSADGRFLIDSTAKSRGHAFGVFSNWTSSCHADGA